LLLGLTASLPMSKSKRLKRIPTRFSLLFVPLFIVGLLLLSHPLRAAYILEYGLSGAPIPWEITIGKGGAVWFTEQGANRIAQIGVEYGIPTPGCAPWGITSSYDHDDIWFTEENPAGVGKIGRFVPTESPKRFYEYEIPDWGGLKSRPRGIAMNITRQGSPLKIPRYDVWFTEFGRDRIDHLTSSDGTNVVFSFYGIPGQAPGTPNALEPLNIAMSPVDYSIWFTESKKGRIGSLRLLENGTAFFRQYEVNVGSPDEPRLWGLAIDPKGFVWVTEPKRNRLGRLNPVSGEYVTFEIPTANSEPREIALEVYPYSGPSGQTPSTSLLNVWFTEHSGDKVARYDPNLNVFYEYPIISTGGRPNGIAIYGSSVYFTEPILQKIGYLYNYLTPVTTTTVGTIISATTTRTTVNNTYITKELASASTSTTGTTITTSWYPSITSVTTTQTFTSSRLVATTTSIYSYTVTSRTTSTTTSSTTTTGTQTIVTVSTIPATTSTTATSTSVTVQTSSTTTSATSTMVSVSVSSTTTSVTATSTSIYPTVTVTLTNASYLSTTTFSPTVTEVSTKVSSVFTTLSTTVPVTTTTTTITTVGITRPCLIASAAYGSELAPQVQSLRGFRDRIVIKTFAGEQFMQVFNAFYYSFSPSIANAVNSSPALADLTRLIISPLVEALRITAAMSTMLGNNELSVVSSGLTASAMIGLLYVSPLMLATRLAIGKRKGGR